MTSSSLIGISILFYHYLTKVILNSSLLINMIGFLLFMIRVGKLESRHGVIVYYGIRNPQ